MTTLEELQKDTAVSGLIPNQIITIIGQEQHGPDAITLVYRDGNGQLHEQVIDRSYEGRLHIVSGQQWTFDGDGALLKLASEAQRIRWAHLFDPYLAVHTSLVQPLPHQITAVYDHMLPRHPLKFLLADDPGAGKTIMAGLLIKELIIRGDLQRCLVVCPGSLAEQWQEELRNKFHLHFQVLTNEQINAAASGNVFNDINLMIARLDKLARDDELHALLNHSDWDLIVCDEAHKMSATVFGGEIKYTKRYHLGRTLSQITRHFLLMTATPHNGKEEDFQLFMALLDRDRFEGRFRENAHGRTDVTDLMRRMVKENLLKFDGRPLFPERRAYTVAYKLSPLERELYDAVTAYVREEFNRAEKLAEDGRRGTVGFALTVLQRRLASSTEAIYQSLRRRRERLEERLREAQLNRLTGLVADWSADEFDEDDYTAEELEELETAFIDQATTARTIEELQIEIGILQDLEILARRTRQHDDRKWVELRGLLLDEQEMYDAQGHRRKLVIFTEHKDTLYYLLGNIQALFGRAEAVVTIHGGIRREERHAVEAAFRNEPDVSVLLATDAAGEGINLQRAHLMVNYDLPWNPNRLEQRFGRIHRIGQEEVCHLWNLVADETREGDVYKTLLRKLEQERETLQGAVFDVLGQALPGRELRRLMIEAIRYGERPDIRAQLHQEVEGAFDHDRLRALVEEQALARDVMDTSQVQAIRLEMERMEARRLQPHFIQHFFMQAIEQLGGAIRRRESNRYELTHVPAALRRHNPQLPRRYARICFEKEYIRADNPEAEFVCPGHPLLDAMIDVMLLQHRPVLQQGSVLVDVNNPDETPRVLFYLEHAIQDGIADRSGRFRTISRRFQFVEMVLAVDDSPRFYNAGPSPYLDYEPISAADQVLVADLIGQVQAMPHIDRYARDYAITQIAPEHLVEVKADREPLTTKTYAAVKARLTAEIVYWDTQAQHFLAQARDGKVNAQLNAELAQRRADDLAVRRDKRLAELEQERHLASQPPRVIGGALIIPGGLLARLKGRRTATFARSAAERKRVELLGMQTVMAVERMLGNTPRDVASENKGYDVESTTPDGKLRLIEVKGRVADADTVTITRNEIMVALNKQKDWFLAIVKVPLVEDFPDGDVFAVKDEKEHYTAGVPIGCEVRYVNQPFTREPEENAVGINFNLSSLWSMGFEPSFIANSESIEG